MGKGLNLRIARRALLATVAASASYRPARAARPIIVASKIDTEGALLGNLIAQVLRARGLAVQTRLQLGPTRILRQALLSGAIDLYPEYTGNGARFFNLAGNPAWHSAPDAYALAARLDRAANQLIWLAPAPADNGWGIAVPPRMAQLATLSGFAQATRQASPPILLAASVEFVETADALPAFEHAYGFRMRQDQLLMLAGGDTSATLRAAAEGLSGVNAAMAYGTDGALTTLGLTLLADPMHAQIVFQPAPVIRAAALADHPDIAGWLAALFAGLTRATLQSLNARIAGDGADPSQIAAAYLRAAKLA